MVKRRDETGKAHRNNDMVRSRLLEENGGKCFYCNKALTYMQTIIEHKIPLSRGGKNTDENLVASCRECDFLKGRQTAEEFLNPLTRKRYERTGIRNQRGSLPIEKRTP